MRQSALLLAITATLTLDGVCPGAVNLGDISSRLEKSACPGGLITQQEDETARYIRSLGAAAIPDLLAVLKSSKNRDVRELAGYTLMDMEGLRDEHLNALIGLTARGVIWIPPTTAQIGTPRAITLLLERLKREVGVFQLSPTLCSIASFKENAGGAGPTLIGYLAHNDWDVRAKAARAIGYIGYVEAVPGLIQLLQTDNDWRLVYSSAESLGRLGTLDALPALSQVAQSHWYPPVRAAAQKAVLVLNRQAIYEVKHRKIQPEFPFEFDEYELVGVPTYSSRNGPRGKKGPPYIEQEDALDKTQLDKLLHELQAASSGSDQAGGRTKKRVMRLRFVPEVGMKIREGYLLGSDYGEWGGELGYVDSQGQQTVLLDKNVQGIYTMTSGIVVVSGNLMWNEGNLYRVARDADGAWQVRKWKVLPGTPATSGMLANENLFVGCEDGDIEVSAAGEIKMVTGPW